MALFSYIYINNNKIIAPNDFTPAREDVLAAEFLTYEGKIFADRVGWKYSDLTLEWDTLPQEDLEKLLTTTGEFELTFVDADGTTVTEPVVAKGKTVTGTRFTDNAGRAVWKNVQFAVKFLNTHTE